MQHAFVQNVGNSAQINEASLVYLLEHSGNNCGIGSNQVQTADAQDGNEEHSQSVHCQQRGNGRLQEESMQIGGANTGQQCVIAPMSQTQRMVEE